MSASIKRFYNNQSFEPGEIANVFRKMFSKFGLNESEIRISARYDLSDEGYEYRDINLDEIGSICELVDRPVSLSTVFGEFSNQHRLFIIREGDFLYINIDAPTAEKANKFINDLEEELALIRAYPSIGEEDNTEIINDLAKNLSELEKKVLGGEALYCFLSYRFNLKSKNYALELMRFLALIGVEVTTGSGYEPRRVSDKVLSHLDKPLDFVIYLIEKEGESAWTRDEMAVSLGKGYHIIPLVEEGSTLEKGLLGDWEYIPFSSGHISDTYISILEAIKFINQEQDSPQVCHI